jgi:Fe-S-cluster containining protein
MCCNGVLHKVANLAPQEIFFAESLGLTTRTTSEKPTFDLPCPCWHKGRCRVYPLRPNVCDTYRCKLLRGLDAQQVTFEVALAHVKQVQTLIDEIEAMIGDRSTSDSIWTRLQRFAKQQGYHEESVQFAQAFPALKLKASSLHWLLHRHFQRTKPK